MKLQHGVAAREPDRDLVAIVKVLNVQLLMVVPVTQGCLLMKSYVSVVALEFVIPIRNMPVRAKI